MHSEMKVYGEMMLKEETPDLGRECRRMDWRECSGLKGTSSPTHCRMSRTERS
jgi:hypothetical protein